ncbi:MAG: hypothetical protein GY841_20285, partial [FCB group bacterium]|nr:hypothetical protein [FCB group bacterium]
PIWLQSWTSNSENGRNGFKFSGFELTHDGQYIVVTDGENSVLFYNTETGEIDHTVSGFSEGRVVGISGDGSKAVLLCYGDPMVAHQIDLTTHEITESVSITGYGLSTYEVSVNQDGSKAFIGVQSNASALVRFETSDFLIFTDTYTPFWIGTSPDNRYAIGGQYRFSIIDFETESVAGQYYGNSQYVGDVSKTGFRAVGADPYRHEGIYFYDYEDGFPDYLGTTVSGRGPEGDAPRRVAITPDGTKAIATNVLSDNATIINLESYEIEAIIP